MAERKKMKTTTLEELKKIVPQATEISVVSLIDLDEKDAVINEVVGLRSIGFREWQERQALAEKLKQEEADLEKVSTFATSLKSKVWGRAYAQKPILKEWSNENSTLHSPEKIAQYSERIDKVLSENYEQYARYMKLKATVKDTEDQVLRATESFKNAFAQAERKMNAYAEKVNDESLRYAKLWPQKAAKATG